MAKRAPSLNNFCWLAGLLLLLCQCRQDTDSLPTIPSVFAAANQVGWQHKEGRLWLNNRLFSGWQYELNARGDTIFVGAFNQGKAEGTHWQWYANGQPKEVRHFRGGWQQGEQQGWFSSGRPAFIYHFHNDVYEGNVKEWLPNGRLVKDGAYHEGQENGSQRQWFADGSLKANYVVRNGRAYGFTGVKNCVNVWDSISISP